MRIKKSQLIIWGVGLILILFLKFVSGLDGDVGGGFGISVIVTSPENINNTNSTNNLNDITTNLNDLNDDDQDDESNNQKIIFTLPSSNEGTDKISTNNLNQTKTNLPLEKIQLGISNGVDEKDKESVNLKMIILGINIIVLLIILLIILNILNNANLREGFYG